ncbi:MAG: hypothetical protein E3J72_12215 [Planctomycetota bacterium]|nr:MAG: hypothetical protein E3J72_12215 [Planctomycetota bacterium]
MKNSRDKTIYDLEFEQWSTGGGVEVLRRDLSENRYILITNPDDINIPNPSGPFLVGLYDEEESQIESLRFYTVDEIEQYILRINNR